MPLKVAQVHFFQQSIFRLLLEFQNFLLGFCPLYNQVSNGRIADFGRGNSFIYNQKNYSRANQDSQRQIKPG